MPGKQSWIALGIGIAWPLGGCGAIDNPLGNEALISSDVREVCEGVLDDAEILSSLMAARVDQFNGYTKSEELQTARQGCTVQVFGSDLGVEECIACKTAILNDVYGP